MVPPNREPDARGRILVGESVREANCLILMVPR